MKYFLSILVAGIFLANCQDQKTDPHACSVTASVIDLRPLDGCDFAFELENGTRLLPERRTYIRAPEKESDPIYYYEFKTGNRVTIGYVESSSLSACMAGRMVFITCISDLKD